MGEVGAESPTTTTTATSKLNGETNGNCEEDEQMEVDGDEDLEVAKQASETKTPLSTTKELIKNGINNNTSEESDNVKQNDVEGINDSEKEKNIVSNGGENGIDDVVHTLSDDSGDDIDENDVNDINEAEIELGMKEKIEQQKTKDSNIENDGSNEVEAMEVDSSAMKKRLLAAGTATSNATVASSTRTNMKPTIENDKPVSIHSDSDLDETEDENSNTDNERQIQHLQRSPPQDQPQNLKKTSNNNGSCPSPEVQEILSDKEEDCVLIDDRDLSPAASRQSGRSRQRKNMVTIREYSTYTNDEDEDDDDVEEVLEDPLKTSPPPQILKAAKPRLLPNPMIYKDSGNSAVGKNYDFQSHNFKNHFNQQNSSTNNSTNNNKKEPSLVIIDTNTMMAQRAMNANNSGMNNNSNISPSNNHNSILSNKNNSLSVMPIGVPAQGVYPVNMRQTTGSNNNLNNMNMNMNNSINSNINNFQNSINKPISHQNLLPALTDDMFVLEAPSFIVPYIYEKPPSDNLKELVSKMAVEIEDINKKIPTPPTPATTSANENDDKKLNSTAGTDTNKDSDDKKDKKGRNGRQLKNPDDSWDESDTSTDDEASDSEQRTKVLIKEVKEDISTIITPESINKSMIGSTDPPSVIGANGQDPEKKSDNFFDNPLGKFFMNIGINLVQEYVQTDLLRIQKRKRDREGQQSSASTQMAINSLMKNLELSKENNEPFKFELKRCEYCAFKSESSLAMAHHYETPHMRNYVYKCNFCSYETRPPHDILYHMEAVHNIKGHLEKAPAYHQCPNCTFEDNGKSKLARHSIACIKKFRPEANLCPPIEWEPPAKIPRIKPKHGLVGTATAYQAMAAQQRAVNILPRNNNIAVNANINNNNNNNNAVALQAAAALRARGRPQTVTKPSPSGTILRGAGIGGVPGMGMGGVGNAGLGNVVGGMAGQQNNFKSQLPSGLQNNLQFAAAALAAAGNQFLQQVAGGLTMLPNNQSSLTIQSSMSGQKQQKPSQQPSISITPLPRQPTSSSSSSSSGGGSINNSGSGGHSNNFSNNTNTKIPPGVSPNLKPGQNPNATGKTTFVICEICDGYIKDLDQLRNHMQWIHKVKIHPKMIYNRPPLNCQKCQFRFFTDQGLERHLLGSHGLVTSSMQEAANKGKDAGRCPVCGRVYQWKLLNHVSRDHDMTLKPAHLSYKCTVCTATFGMYKQFESHVYSAHSTVAKKSIDNKNKQQSSSNHHNSNMGSSSKNGGDSLLKPLKINDEITIIPQPSSHHKLSKLNNSGPIEIE